MLYSALDGSPFGIVYDIPVLECASDHNYMDQKFALKVGLCIILMLKHSFALNLSEALVVVSVSVVAAKGQADKSDTVEKNGVRSLRVSPDGQHLASGDRLGNIRSVEGETEGGDRGGEVTAGQP